MWVIRIINTAEPSRQKYLAEYEGGLKFWATPWVTEQRLAAITFPTREAAEEVVVGMLLRWDSVQNSELWSLDVEELDAHQPNASQTDP